MYNIYIDGKHIQVTAMRHEKVQINSMYCHEMWKGVKFKARSVSFK